MQNVPIKTGLLLWFSETKPSITFKTTNNAWYPLGLHGWEQIAVLWSNLQTKTPKPRKTIRTEYSEQMQEGAYRYLNIVRYMRDILYCQKSVSGLKVRYWQVNMEITSRNTSAQLSLGLRMRRWESLEKQILIVLKMVSGIKLKSRKEMCQIK